MEGIVKAIRSCNEGDPTDLEKLKKKLKRDANIIIREGSSIPSALDVLNPLKHTLGYTILLNHMTAEVKDHSQFANYSMTLLANAHGEQICYCPQEFSNISHFLCQSLVFMNVPHLGIKPLNHALRLMQQNDYNMLTPIHRDFVLCCVKSKCYSDALSVCDTPIYQVSKDNGLTSLDFLSYMYYSGVVYIAVKKYSAAVESFQLALTAPSQAISSVQVAAYKKYILCGLLAYGELLKLPGKITSTAVSRAAPSASKAYGELATAFKSDSVDRLKGAIEEGRAAFVTDNNLGLVKQTLDCLVRRKIQRLTNTYVTLTLDEIADQAGLDSAAAAEEYVLQMIEKGEIFAKIDKIANVVAFQDNPESYDSSDMVQKMDDSIRQVMHIKEKLDETNRRIQTSESFIRNNLPKIDDEKSNDSDLAKAMAASMKEQ